MKKSFYVHKHPLQNGDHEVHNEDCHYLPGVADRIYLGAFNNCQAAVGVARLTYPGASGCQTCSPVAVPAKLNRCKTTNPNQN